MKILSRYIFKQVVLVTLFVTLVLTFVLLLAQSLRATGLIITHGLGLLGIFRMVFFLLPDIWMIILPISLFISVIITYNRLIVEHEMVVMEAIGLNPFQIALPALKVAFIAMVLLYSISFYFLPISFQKFRSLQWDYRSQFNLTFLQEGEFLEASGLTIYVRARKANEELQGVFLYDRRNRQSPVVFTAQKGRLIETPTGVRIILFQGTRQAYDGKNQGLSFLHFDEYAHDIKKPEKAIEQRQKKPSERFIHELFKAFPEETLEQQHRCYVEGHQRLLTPLYPIAFVLLVLRNLLKHQHVRIRRVKPLLIASLQMLLTQVLVLGCLQYSSRMRGSILVAYLIVIVPIGVNILFLLSSSLKAKMKRGILFKAREG